MTAAPPYLPNLSWVECKVIDITTFSLDPCLAVAPDAACDAACKAELDKLPAPCVSSRTRAAARLAAAPAQAAPTPASTARRARTAARACDMPCALLVVQLDRIATSVYESNDTENIDKFEGQLIACNITFEIAPAPAPAPLPW